MCFKSHYFEENNVPSGRLGIKWKTLNDIILVVSLSQKFATVMLPGVRLICIVHPQYFDLIYTQFCYVGLLHHQPLYNVSQYVAGPSHSAVTGPSSSTGNGPSRSTVTGPSTWTASGPSRSAAPRFTSSATATREEQSDNSEYLAYTAYIPFSKCCAHLTHWAFNKKEEGIED